MRRRKSKALPRITLLAYSSKELARFNESMEALQGLARGMEVSLVRLEAVAARLEAARPTKGARKGKSPPDTVDAAREALGAFTGHRNGNAAGDVAGAGPAPK